MKIKRVIINFLIYVMLAYSTTQPSGVPPLVEAAQQDDYEIFVATIIKEFLNLGIKDPDGNTALHHACMRLNHRYIKTLLDYERLSLNDTTTLAFVENNDKQTPISLLLHATLDCEVIREILNEFLLAGIDINHRNSEGNTALHLFIQQYNNSLLFENESRSLALLKECDMDATIKNNYGKKPFDLIKEKSTQDTLVALWHSPATKKQLPPTKIKQPGYVVSSLCWPL